MVAAQRGLSVLKPAKIRTAEFLAELSALNPDLVVVAAYGRILPDPVLAAARIMPINVHASLLPRHRGASPVEGAILAGDIESGVTIMRVTSKMDAGPMLLACAIPIAPRETQATLKEKLAELGAAALLEVLEKLRHGPLVETPQDESRATYTSPVSKADAVIDWNADAARIERMVRAYDPWPVARTRLGDDELLVWRAALDDSASPGGPRRRPQPASRSPRHRGADEAGRSRAVRARKNRARRGASGGTQTDGRGGVSARAARHPRDPTGMKGRPPIVPPARREGGIAGTGASTPGAAMPAGGAASKSRSAARRAWRPAAPRSKFVAWRATRPSPT